MNKRLGIVAAGIAAIAAAASARPTNVGPKWIQPPVSTVPTNVFYGWNQYSVYGGPQLSADDFRALSNQPVVGVRWWGSFIDWRGQALPPEAPDEFHIAIWTDIPVGPQPYSHPGTLVWEYRTGNSYQSQFFGWDYDPQQNTFDAAFEFEVKIPQAQWFNQVPGQIYWLSVSAIYRDPNCACRGDIDGNGVVNAADVGIVIGQFGCPVGTGSILCDRSDVNCDGVVDNQDRDAVVCQLGTAGGIPQCCTRVPDRYPYGNKTRKRDPNSPAPDAAVAIFDPNRPTLGSNWINGQPLWWPSNTDPWDLCFEILTIAPTACLCNPDFNGDGVVNNLDVGIFAGCFGLPPVGPCAPTDLNCDGAIDNADFAILQCFIAGGANCCPPLQQVPKWSQRPVPHTVGNAFVGWNDPSIYGSTQISADDWLCVSTSDVQNIRWWGSFIGWAQKSLPPQRPTKFHLAIWTDVQPSVGGTPFSHPGRVIWEQTVDITNVGTRFAGWDFDPRGIDGPDACFQFEANIPRCLTFRQPTGTNLFWLSIAAIYNQCPCNPDLDHNGIVDAADLAMLGACFGPVVPACSQADLNCDGVVDGADQQILICSYGGPPNPQCCPGIEYLYGNKTRPRNPNSPAPDAAVRIFNPTAPVLNSIWVNGVPILFPTTAQWDLCFELRPTCAGDANGDRRVDGADLSVLLGQFGQFVPAGTGADFNCDGRVNGADLSVLLGTFGKNCP